MKNKNGFTLVELLAVIAIIALISLVAIPNIVGISTGVRKDQMLDDAKKLISLAKYQVSKSYTIRNSARYVFTFDDLNVNGEFKKINEAGDVLDPDNGKYVRANSKVIYENTGKAKYSVYLEGSIRKICLMPANCDNSACCTEPVPEENLYSRNNVVDIDDVDND